jgi:hypothetical protein
MPNKDRLFLTIDEALEAIRDRFRAIYFPVEPALR